MATGQKNGSRSGTGKSASAKSRSTAKPAEKKPQAASAAAINRQKAAIIFMAVAVFLIFVVLIEGESVWSSLHNGMFGLFGFCAFLWPLMLIYMSVVYAKEKPLGSIAASVMGSGLFVVLFGGAVHIAFNTAEYLSMASFSQQLVDAWGEKTAVGGGFFGALVGGALAKLFGKTGAIITVIILLFVVLMLITGTTVSRLFSAISKPVKKVGEYTNEKFEQGFERREREHAESGEEEKKKSLFSPPKAPTKAAPDISAEPVITEEKKPAAVQPEIPVIRLKEDPVKPVVNAVEAAVAEAAAPVKKKRAVKKIEVAEPELTIEADTSVSYEYPSIDCLDLLPPGNAAGSVEEKNYNSRVLIETLESFNIKAEIVDVCVGPSVTRYELVPQAGVRINKITSLADDIALRLAASGVRIEAPIPNKSAIGIEVPNKNKSMVGMREIIDTPKYHEAKSKLNVALGKDITGNIICADLAKMPHLLVAGTTGSGKSVCLNSMIISILFNASPDEVKLLMIDPKQVEFNVYNGIAHLEVPVVTDARKAAGALGWAVSEMQRRYKLFSENNVRDIGSYNKMAMRRDDLKPLHQIVIFIDELSDLMMVAPNEVEDSICRLAQMARAAGMHLVIATQRPSVDVITGIIKANIPSRIALFVSSQVDSRTILDTAGAEKLLGNGDMLFSPVGKNKPVRVQGCYISEQEVERVVDHIKEQSKDKPVYNEDTLHEIETIAAQTACAKKKGSSAALDEQGGERDEMVDKAIEVIVEMQAASTTMLQKKLKLGYARASRIIDEIEEMGIIGPSEGAKPRAVLMSKQQWYEMSALSGAAADDSISSEPVPVSDYVDIYSSSEPEQYEFDDDEPDDDEPDEVEPIEVEPIEVEPIEVEPIIVEPGDDKPDKDEDEDDWLMAAVLLGEVFGDDEE